MAEETVQRLINSYNNTSFYGWAIECKGKLIGTIGAYDYDSENFGSTKPMQNAGMKHTSTLPFKLNNDINKASALFFCVISHLSPSLLITNIKEIQ